MNDNDLTKSTEQNVAANANAVSIPMKVVSSDKDSRNPGTSIEEHMEFALENPHETGSDVTFLVGPEEEEISAHKQILGIISPVFHHVFYDTRLKDVKNHMNLLLPDVSPDTFKMMLKYIYIRKTRDMNFEEANGLYLLAHRFKIPDLSTKCMASMKKTTAALGAEGGQDAKLIVKKEQAEKTPSQDE